MNKPIKVDIRVPVRRPIPEAADFIRRCEDAGFDGVGVHDHHHSGRDVYVTLALTAACTERLVLYPDTSNTLTRHPLVLAALANSLGEIAPGRILLTLAPGYLSAESVGRKATSLRQLREDVSSVRRLLAGEKVPLAGGGHLRLNNRTHSQPLVLLMAAGPGMLELAGEVADGVLMLVDLHPNPIAAACERLAAGVRKAGRGPEELQKIFIVPIAVGERAVVREWSRRRFREGKPWMEYPSRSNLRWFEEAGIDLPASTEPSSTLMGSRIESATPSGSVRRARALCRAADQSE